MSAIIIIYALIILILLISGIKNAETIYDYYDTFIIVAFVTVLTAFICGVILTFK